jgi:hypothetical protein
MYASSYLDVTYPLLDLASLCCKLKVFWDEMMLKSLIKFTCEAVRTHVLFEGQSIMIVFILSSMMNRVSVLGKLDG